MFDTHCHLNFQALSATVQEIINGASEKGVTHIVVPGTDVPTSRRAVEIANEFENVYAAVGVHPHHVFEAQERNEEVPFQKELAEIEELLKDPKVLAVGEVGLDKHYYAKTKYDNYDVDSKFVEAQIQIFEEHVRLALKYKKSLIIHHREAKKEMLETLNKLWDDEFEKKSVIHCCEPDLELFHFAQKHNMFIGIDGDVTYDKKKQGFIKEVPLDMLVLETDAPFLVPEPFRSQPRDTRGPNVPANLLLIAEKVAQLKEYDVEEVKKVTFSNAMELFQLSKEI